MSELGLRKIGLSVVVFALAILGAWWIFFSEEWALLVPAFIVGVLILNRPFWGLLIFAILIPLESAFLSIGGGAATVTRFIGLFVFGVWLVGELIHHRRIFVPISLRFAIFFFLWGSLSFFWATNRGVTTNRIFMAVQLVMLAFLVFNLVKERSQTKLVISALLVGCLAVTILGIIGIGIESGSELLTLKNQGAKEYGSYIGIVTLVGSLLFVFEKHMYRWLGLSAVLISIVPLIRVNQRGILLALAITWLVVALATRQKIKTFVFIALMALGFYILPQTLEQRGAISSFNAERLTISNILETGGSGRTDIWGAGLRMFADNFLLGTGWGNFPVVYDKYANPMEIITSNLSANGKDPHGDLVGVAGELGIIGLILFLIVFLRVFLRNLALVQTCWNTQNRLLTILVFALLLYMFSLGFTSTFLWRKVYWLILGLGISLPVLINQRVNIKPARFHRF